VRVDRSTVSAPGEKATSPRAQASAAMNSEETNNSFFVSGKDFARLNNSYHEI
jgi:hypothetical protein